MSVQMKSKKLIVFISILVALIFSFSLKSLIHIEGQTKNNADNIEDHQLETINIKSNKTETVFSETKSTAQEINKHSEAKAFRSNSVNLNVSSDRTDTKEENKSDEGVLDAEKKAESKEKLYQPIYNSDIARSSSKAYFLLQDAKGKLLEPGIVEKIRIWRNIKNDLWIEEDAKFNSNKSMIECEGINHQGIEPGFYSVEVDGGGYGVLKFKFILKKNEDYQATYIMPNYHKVITLQFVDQDGLIVENIRSRPVYQWSANVEPFSKYESQERLILKQTPNYGSIRGGGMSLSYHTSGCGVGTKDYVFKVKDGKYYLRVFSGQEGKISYVYRENEGSKAPFVLEGRFEDKFDTLIIQLDQQPKITENTLEYHSSSSNSDETTGYNINLPPMEYSTKEEKFDTTIKGISVQSKNTHFPLQLEYIVGPYKAQLIKGDGYLFQKNFGPYENWSEIKIRLVDKKFFKSSWEEFPLEDGVVAYKELKLNLKEFKVNFLLSPTFDEMAKDFSMVTSEDSAFDLLYSNKGLYFTSLFNAEGSMLDEKLKLSIRSHISVFNSVNGIFDPCNYNNKEKMFEDSISIEVSELINSPTKEIEISPFQNTLIARAINTLDAGLPWVEASLVAAENLSIAYEIRKAFNDSNYFNFLNDLARVPFSDPSDGNFKVETFDKLKLIFPKIEVYDYFLKNGTWYSSTAKSVSDSKGYLVLKSNELIPGKKYVLFLWGLSQDELKPDKEILFVAKKGITDLGVIKFD